jgi:hypothetical protein
MRFTANIPKIGEINVDGNFATEDTLEKLVRVLTNAQSKSKNNHEKSDKSFGELNDTIGTSNKNLDEFSDELERAEKSQGKVADGLNAMYSSVTGAASGLARMGAETSSLSDVVSGFGDAVGDTIQGLGSALGPIGATVGKGLGVATTAFTGAVAFAVGALEEFSVYNKSVLDAGLGMAGGFESIATAANAAGIPIGKFTQALVSNTDVLRSLAGGGPGGIKLVAGAFRSFNAETKNQLYAMGFTTEEIISSMANYADTARRAGKNLTTEELAAGSQDYLKNLRELNRLTGVSVKEQLANLEVQRSDLFIRNQLLSLDENQRVAASSFIAALDPAEKVFTDFIMSGASTNDASAQLVSMMPMYANVLREAYLTSVNENMSLEESNAYRKKLLDENADAIAQERDNATRLLGAAPAAVYGSLEGLVTATGELALASERQVEAAKSSADAMDLTNMSDFQLAIGATTTVMDELQSTIQTVTVEGLIRASGLLNTSLTVMGDSTQQLREMILEYREGTIPGTNNVSAGNATADAAADYLPGSVGSLERINELAARFSSDASSISLEEKQDLITAMRRLQRSESYDSLGIGTGFGGNIIRGSLELLPQVGEVLGDIGGANIDARLADDELIMGSIRNLGLGNTSGAVQNAFDTNNSPTNSAVSNTLSTSPSDRRNPFESAQTSAATTEINSDEMLRINRTMADRMSMQIEQQGQIIKVLQEQNTIARNSAYARA